MNKKRHSDQTTPIELAKDVLIVLLLCSALFLLWEAQLLVGLQNPLAQTETTLLEQEQVYQIQAEAARPIRMAAISGESGELYGIQYDDDAVDILFQLSSNILRETLGSLDEPTPLSEQQWQDMLQSAPGLYLDLAGNVPLSILSGWLSGQEDAELTAVPRRLLLTTTQEGLVALCYQDESGGFYCSTTQVVDRVRLSAVADQFSQNGAQFAFQIDGFDAIDPYTLISASTPEQMAYYVTNPISTDESRAELLSLLGLDVYGSSVYTSTDGLGIVLRHDTDTLRIYGSGIVTYQGEEGLSLYPVAAASQQPTQFDIVESCRSLATSVLVPFCGDARLHLLSIVEENSRWIVNFCYTLNGSPVQFPDGGEAAQFIVEEGEILEFTLRLRNYIPSNELQPLLPESQAIAAVSALGYQGQELILSYYDSGVSLLYPDWVASDR